MTHRLFPSCRTCSGIHRVAHSAAGVNAAQWIPEQIQGDEVVGEIIA